MAEPPQPAVHPTRTANGARFNSPVRPTPPMSRDILARCWLCGRPNPWRLRRALHRRVVFGLAERDGLRRCPAFGPRPVRGAGLGGQVIEYLRQLLQALLYLLHPCSRLNDHRVFNAGDALYGAADELPDLPRFIGRSNTRERRRG